MNKKTKAKAYGLKQIIVKDNDLFMSQFEKGNDYKIVKIVKEDDNVISLAEEASFDVTSQKQNLSLEKKLKKSGVVDKIHINNPLKSPNRQDYLRFKPLLEKEFFGQTFNDNVHIQMIYAIMDIKKILSLYVYNVVYLVNNLDRNQIFTDEKSDLIGTLPTFIPYQRYEKKDKFSAFEDNAKGFFKYYPILRSPLDEKENSKKSKYSLDEHNYNCIRLLSVLRQFCGHGKGDNRTTLFQRNCLTSDLYEFLNSIFDKEVEKVNRDFMTNAKKNLLIISEVMCQDIDKELANKYYEFTVIKDQKNIGINIKKLKEALYQVLLEKFSVRIKDELDQKNAHLLAKINLVHEFILWDILRNNQELQTSIVEDLRLGLNDDDKQSVYLMYAEEILKKNKDLFIFENVSTVVSVVKSHAADKNIKEKDIKIDVAINPKDFQLFSKLVYFISCFLDGKEKNELITALINKFENIYLFKDMLNDPCLNEKGNFTAKYDMFNMPIQVNELRLIKNLSKMKSPKDGTTEALYKDALYSLGLFDENQIKQEIDQIRAKKAKGKNKFRNFLINNVMNSTRFQYIAKYTNPKVIPSIIRCEQTINLVLKNLPEEQINRYYSTVIGTRNKNLEEKIDELKFNLSKFNYKTLKEEKKYIDNPQQNNKLVERIKALAGLYYTVAFIIIKSLIKVNSIYTIAFSTFERDYLTAFGSIPDDPENSKNEPLYNKHCLDLINRNFGIEGFYKKHDREYLLKNISEFNEYGGLNEMNFFKTVRNNTMHLNVINKLKNYNQIQHVNSYFELYHFIMQSLVVKIHPTLKQIGPIVRADKSYSKDLMKILYLPFAYNLARYKHLTIEDIFNI